MAALICSRTPLGQTLVHAQAKNRTGPAKRRTPYIAGPPADDPARSNAAILARFPCHRHNEREPLLHRHLDRDEVVNHVRAAVRVALLRLRVPLVVRAAGERASPGPSRSASTSTDQSASRTASVLAELRRGPRLPAVGADLDLRHLRSRPPTPCPRSLYACPPRPPRPVAGRRDDRLRLHRGDRARVAATRSPARSQNE